jgi:nucleoside-diphosphate-sugar epimerase
VLGLARSEAGAAQLAAAGAEVLRGTLDDHAILAHGAAQADGVIHTAFNHDFSRFAENCEQDRLAIETLGSALQGSGRPLVVTSGLAGLAPGRMALESDMPPPPSPAFPRASEASADAVAARGVNVSVVRLSPSVHGDGDHGFVPILIDIARRSGRSAWVGDGANRWPAVHRLDAARVYRLALERAESGARYHAAAEEGIAFREIAGVIGRRLGLPVVGLDGAQADAHFSWFAIFAGWEMAASSAWTREVLGWKPEQVGLIEDIDRPAYFAA